MVDWPESFTGKYTVTFPDFIQNGVPMQYTADPAADIDASDRLPNFWIYPQHSGDSSYFRVLISGQAEPPTGVPSNTKLQVVIRFDKMIPEIIFGQFGTIPVYDKQMTMPFTFFDSYDLNDGIEFTGMSINVNIDNYTGLP
jgi:hypothetical protein